MGLEPSVDVAYLIVMLMIAGVLSYFKLGRAEDPDFTVKVMVVRTPGPARRRTRSNSRSPNASRRG